MPEYLPILADLIGKPFVNKGRDIETGLDCWGMAIEVFRRYGLELPDFTVDSRAHGTIDALAKGNIAARYWEKISHVTDKDVPLIVLMRIHPKYITHAGVYISNGKIIHTIEKTGVIISRASTLQNQIVGYYRYVNNN